jgi:hypothetical protein
MSDVCWLGRLAWARLPGLGEAGCLGRNRLAWAWARPAAWARRARLGEAGYAGRLGHIQTDPGGGGPLGGPACVITNLRKTALCGVA